MVSCGSFAVIFGKSLNSLVTIDDAGVTIEGSGDLFNNGSNGSISEVRPKSNFEPVR